MASRVELTSPSSNSMESSQAASPSAPSDRQQRSSYLRNSSTLMVVEDEEAQEMSGRKKKAFSLFSIFGHNSHFKINWDYCVLFFNFTIFLVVPLQIAFDTLSTTFRIIYQAILCLAFAFNVFVHFRTEVPRTRAIITDPKTIARLYMRKWFWFDLISTIPIPFVLEGFGVEKDLAQLISLIRTTRLLSRQSYSAAYSKTIVRMARMVVAALLMAHWIGCLWFYLSDYEGFIPSTGVPDNGCGGLIASKDILSEATTFQYYLSLHFGVRALISMGSELSPCTNWQITLALVSILLGIVVFSVILGNVEIMLAQSAANSIKFQEHIHSLTDFIHHYHLPSSLGKKILLHTHHWYRTHRGLEDNHLLSSLPSELRAKVYRYMYKSQLEQCSFFEKCSPAFVDALCSEVRPQVALEGDIIIRQGATDGIMYIVQTGVAEAVDLVTQQIYSEMGAGKFFGEIALLANVQRTLSVRAKTYMELYVLERESFLRVLELFPEEQSVFAEVAKARIKNTGKIARSLIGSDTNDTLNEGAYTRWSEGDVVRFVEKHNLKHLLDTVGIKKIAGFIAQFDADGNGVLDEEETVAIVKYLKALGNRMQSVAGLVDDSDEDDATQPSMLRARSSKRPPLNKQASMLQRRQASTPPNEVSLSRQDSELKLQDDLMVEPTLPTRSPLNRQNTDDSLAAADFPYSDVPPLNLKASDNLDMLRRRPQDVASALRLLLGPSVNVSSIRKSLRQIVTALTIVRMDDSDSDSDSEVDLTNIDPVKMMRQQREEKLPKSARGPSKKKTKKKVKRYGTTTKLPSGPRKTNKTKKPKQPKKISDTASVTESVTSSVLPYTDGSMISENPNSDTDDTSESD